jgi:TusA-related sulfurtransferase
MTFVRARLALDRMAVGERILIVLRGEEATRGVPANAEALGHHVVTTTQGADGTVAVLLRKG